MEQTEKEYLFGTNEPELARLQFQHEVWRPMTDTFLQWLNIQKGWKCLDAGSGPGFVSMDLRQLVGDEGEVTLLEPSTFYINSFKSVADLNGWSNVNYIRGTVEESELPADKFDVIFSRWVISFVPDPEKFVANLVKALKPGGILAIEDYNYDGLSLFPKGGAWDKMPDFMKSYYKFGGGDPYVASRLPGIYKKCGLELIDYKPFSMAGGPDSGVMEWAHKFFTIHVPIMVERAIITPEEGKAFQDDWQIHREDPDAVFFSPVVVDAAGRKK
jgi:ubiquinone/menaquinone biosynthesis C-methylase UbiE